MPLTAEPSGDAMAQSMSMSSQHVNPYGKVPLLLGSLLGFHSPGPFWLNVLEDSVQVFLNGNGIVLHVLNAPSLHHEFSRFENDTVISVTKHSSADDVLTCLDKIWKGFSPAITFA